MSVTAIVATVYDERTLAVSVSGAEPMSAEYSTVVFNPRTLSVRFARDDQGPWRIRSVRLLGYQRLKSGEDGANHKERSMWSNGYSGRAGHFEKIAPEWLRDFVETELAALNA